MQDPKKIARKLPSGHHHTTLLGYTFATETHIDKRKKLVEQLAGNAGPKLEMWANVQRDGRPAEYRCHPLSNAAKFG